MIQLTGICFSWKNHSFSQTFTIKDDLCWLRTVNIDQYHSKLLSCSCRAAPADQTPAAITHRSSFKLIGKTEEIYLTELRKQGFNC